MNGELLNLPDVIKIGLITTAGMVYVPRFGAAIKRIKSERIKQTENLNRYEQREPVIHAENNGERPAPNLNNPPLVSGLWELHRQEVPDSGNSEYLERKSPAVSSV